MITNLIFDLSGYGGSANFTAATEAILINELNTLTGVTWFWDPADCKPKSNFYPGVPPVITTAYKVSFVDIDGDSTGFCNAGSLDFTKFNEIDLTAYGGSATTAVTNNTDIVNAFAALSLTVSVVGCKLRINNWNRSITPTDIEVKNNIASCVINTVTTPSFNLVFGRNPAGSPNPFEVILQTFANQVDSNGLIIDWGDTTSNTYMGFPYGGTHVYSGAGSYDLKASFTDNVGGNPVEIFLKITINSIGEVFWLDNSNNNTLTGYKLNSGPTFNTSDCNNVLMSLDTQLLFDPITPPASGDMEVTLVVNGSTFTQTITCGINCNFILTNVNIGSVTVPDTIPFIYTVKDLNTNTIVNTITTNIYLT